MQRTTYAMRVYIDQHTEQRFHCVCDYSPCRCNDDAVIGGIIVSVITHAVHTHSVKPNGRTTFNYCNNSDCDVCLNELPF